MRFQFLNILAITLISVSCTVTGTLYDDQLPELPDDTPKLTLTFHQSGSISIGIVGSGSVVIDWGDGETSETHTVSNNNTNFQRSYSGTGSRTLTIAGKNITRLNCSDSQVTQLEVSEITTLVYLFCSDNELEKLDLSKNAALTDLYCGNNKLTDLKISENKALKNMDCSNNELTELPDLSNNPHLITLLCNDNKLANLSISDCAALRFLNCDSNHLGAPALSVLLLSLHGNALAGGKIISIKNNPGTDACLNKDIAKSNGWEVIDI